MRPGGHYIPSIETMTHGLCPHHTYRSCAAAAAVSRRMPSALAAGAAAEAPTKVAGKAGGPTPPMEFKKENTEVVVVSWFLCLCFRSDQKF